MNSTISRYLKRDEKLKQLVGNKIDPFIPSNAKTYPYIVFETSPFLSAEVTNTYRCDIRVLTQGGKESLLQCETISKRLTELLHFRNNFKVMVDETPIYHSKHVGGGLIYDDELKIYQQLLIFNIKTSI